MKKIEELIKDKDIIYDIIERNKKGRKNKKSDRIKIAELVTDINIDVDIAKILSKNKIDKSEKMIINNYLKNEINNSYNLDNDFYKSFVLTLNLYIYGFENSLVYFRNPVNFVKKDIMIKLILYKNMLLSCGDENILKDDINNMKDFIIDQTQNDIEDVYQENMSTLSYSSSFGIKLERIEDQKSVLDVINYNLEEKNKKLEEELELLKRQLRDQHKSEEIEKENLFLKNKIKSLERKNKLIMFEKDINIKS